MKNYFEREGQRLIEDFERALKAEKAKNIRTKRIPERELRTTPHIEPLFQRSLVTSPRIAILEQLGDTDYIYRFKIRNHATPVTITQDIPRYTRPSKPNSQATGRRPAPSTSSAPTSGPVLSSASPPRPSASTLSANSTSAAISRPTAHLSLAATTPTGPKPSRTASASPWKAVKRRRMPCGCTRQF